MRVLLLSVMFLLLPVTSWAQDAAEQVAAKAQKAHEEHCAQAAGAGAESDAARASVEVSEVWVEVAEVHEASGEQWLLYWRGLLASCIGQNERAAEALVEFVETDPTSAGLAAMAADATKRLKRLRPDYVPPKPPRISPTLEERGHAEQVAGGVVLALGAAGAGVGSGVGFAQLSGTYSTMTSAPHTTAEVEVLLHQGDGQMAAGIGLVAGATAAAVASIASFAAAGRRAQVDVGVLVAPTDGGVVLAVGGRW